MTAQNPKAQEIKRLTTPLTFKNSKAYDCEGNLISCVETLSDVKFIIEPKAGILTDDEIMQYAPDSKAASRIKLKRNIGNMSDVLLIHESMPWIFGIYYVILISIIFCAMFERSSFLMIILMVLFIIPLLYSYYVFNLKNYEEKKKLHPLPKPDIPKATPPKTDTKTISEPAHDLDSVPTLKKYEKQVNDLKVLFDVKEKVVKELIAKRFEPPQITYDRFISMVDSCHKLFYSQADSALNIVNLAVEHTPRIENEIESKISNMKTIINQIEDLTNELVINISSESQDDDEVQNLLDDMENLIGSVKDYDGDSDD